MSDNYNKVYSVTDSVSRVNFIFLADKEVTDEDISAKVREFRNSKNGGPYKVNECLQYLSNKLNIRIMKSDDFYNVAIAHPSENVRNKSLKF